jgi:perosamine synthetase
MKRLDELVSRKRDILRYYRERIEAIPGASMNPEPSGTVSGAWMPTVVFDAQTNVTRDALLSAFQEETIDARVFFHPLSSLPMFQPVQENAIARSLPSRAINLPSYHDISTDDLDRVVQVIFDVVRKAQKATLGALVARSGQADMRDGRRKRLNVNRR